MTEESDGPHARPARSGLHRRLRVALWILGVLALVLLALWAARRPIAGEAIDLTLARAGVPARYDVADLEFGRQRLTNIVLGDPARPDLVADWIETGTRLTWTGATVTAVRAGRVRVRARLVGGHMSLGSLDRLLPAPSGKPFALPRLYLDVTDGRMRLETPAGVVGLRLAGKGRLDDGFDGRLAAVADRLSFRGCTAVRVVTALRVRIIDAAPSLTGPVRAGHLSCAQGMADRLAMDADVALGSALDQWRGSVRLVTGRVTAPGAHAAGVAGTVGFAGSARDTSGRLDLALTDIATGSATARRMAFAGDFRVGRTANFAGVARGNGVAVPGAGFDAAVLAGTPVGPIAERAASALERARRSFGFVAFVAFGTRPAPFVRIGETTAIAASGARVTLTGGDGVSWSTRGVRVDGSLIVRGGDLPGMEVSLAQAAPGAPFRGSALFEPYVARDARLVLAPVTFEATPGGATRVTTSVTLSGPFADGRIDGLALPVTLLWDGRARFAINPGCTPVGFERLAVAGLTLAPTRLGLCASGPALVSVAGGRVEGGARIAASRVAGRLGSTPLTLAASGAEVSLGDRGFSVRDLDVRIGAPGRVTRIDVGMLHGAIGNGGAGDGSGGSFADTGGRIGAVPILLSGADGRWRLANGVLTLGGRATVTDAAERARFEPLRSDDLTFRLADGSIAVTGALLHPATGTRVADVRIAHNLARGTGDALLTLPGVAFDERLQPEALTRLTFGVVADLRGRVAGEGRIAWNPAGVTSTGIFRTDGLDLAAAFGPVTGLAGTIRFDDLLALRSLGGQELRVGTLNPGIAVADGIVRYRTLPDSRVQVEGGRWPFAGGMLLLEPTLLDFARTIPKSLTFRVQGVAADQFLQQFDFSNLNATGVFDGVLPMTFDERGGRIADGRLTVRPGGGTLAYVGAVSQENLGTWGNLAFQALQSIRYRDLGIVMNGPLAGEMVTQVRFSGISQGEGTKSNFVVRRLARLPFVFNIRITAPFRGLIDSAQGFYDPRRLIERNLPTLLDEQNRRATPAPIQPPASRIAP